MTKQILYASEDNVVSLLLYFEERLRSMLAWKSREYLPAFSQIKNPSIFPA